MQNAHLHLCKVEIGVKHILMMYTLQGSPYKQGYDDDNELGASYPLLQLLKKSQLKDLAPFVARHHTYDIGDIRFARYRDAAKLAIAELKEVDKQG